MNPFSLAGDVLFGTSPRDVSRRRTTLFALSVALLLTVARQGEPTLVFGAVLLVFVAASGLWLRGQYTRYLAGDPVVASPWFYLGLVGVAVAMGILYWLLFVNHHPFGGLLLGALVIFYFAIGGLLAVWRKSGLLLAPIGALLFGLALAFVLAGYLLLRGQSTHLLWLGVGCLGIGLLACWPVAVAVLSERGTTYVAEEGSSSLGPLVFGIGLAGAVALGAWTYLASGSTFTVGLLIVLAILTASVASSTRADIVLIIVALALMGFTSGDAGPTPQPKDGAKVLVALGDSYMSGEGASIYFEGTDSAGKDTCRRAPSAWAMQAGYQEFGGTLFLACSGAKSANIRSSDPEGSGLPPLQVQTGEGKTQLQQYADLAAEHHVEPGLVVLSIGGNDAGFSTIGVMCVVPGNCADKASWWTGGLSDVRTSLDATFSQVRDTFPDTPVVVTAYPDPIFEGQGDEPPTANTRLRSCSQVALRPEERLFVARFLGQLNQTIYQVAQAHHFYFLGAMQDALKDAGLQLCDPANHGRPGLNFIGLRSVSGLAEQRFNPANWSHNSLHPNELGHQAMFQTFERWYAAHGRSLQVTAPDEGFDGMTDAAAPASAVVSAAISPHAENDFQPVCSPLDPHPSGCRSRGTHWAAEQTGEALLTSLRALQIALTMSFWWAAVLGFFGWRRRRWSAVPPVNLV